MPSLGYTGSLINRRSLSTPAQFFKPSISWSSCRSSPLSSVWRRRLSLPHFRRSLPRTRALFSAELPRVNRELIKNYERIFLFRFVSLVLFVSFLAALVSRDDNATTFCWWRLPSQMSRMFPRLCLIAIPSARVMTEELLLVCRCRRANKEKAGLWYPVFWDPYIWIKNCLYGKGKGRSEETRACFGAKKKYS